MRRYIIQSFFNRRCPRRRPSGLVRILNFVSDHGPGTRSHLLAGNDKSQFLAAVAK